MRTIYASFWHQIKFFFGLKGVWVGRFTSIGISLLTAFVMGVVYAFNESAQELIGVQNVGIYLLSGFFLQYIVLSSASTVPRIFFAAIRFDVLEYISFYRHSLIKFIIGTFLGTFLTDLFIASPFLIALGVITIGQISVAAFFVFVAFVFISGLLISSIALLFSSFYTLTEHFTGFQGAVSNIITFICGVYFPVQGYLSLFGDIGGWISISFVSILPQTYVFDLSRAILFWGTYQTIFPLWLEVTLFLISTLLVTTLAIFILRKGIKRMKKRGFRSYIY